MSHSASSQKTHIATATATKITVRGRDLVHDLIGCYSFTEMLYFLVVHRMPSAEETRVLDACLVTLMEHGWTPPSLIARVMTNCVPDQVQVAIAAGLLSIGDVNVGTMEGCAALLEEGVAHGGDLDDWCREVVAGFRESHKAIPGFGHSFHKPDDPRSPRLFAIAREANVKGNYIELLYRLSTEVDRAYGKHLTINATGAIGALLLEIGLPPPILRGIAVVSRAAGLCGHIVEEKEKHSARNIWRTIEQHFPYEDPRP
jgi:citrate synthase